MVHDGLVIARCDLVRRNCIKVKYRAARRTGLFGRIGLMALHSWSVRSQRLI